MDVEPEEESGFEGYEVPLESLVQQTAPKERTKKIEPKSTSKGKEKKKQRYNPY